MLVASGTQPLVLVRLVEYCTMYWLPGTPPPAFRIMLVVLGDMPNVGTGTMESAATLLVTLPEVLVTI